jgi:hypothetical protein
MARLPALVDALALHDARSKATLAHIARQVRDGDLIDSRKRGAGAAVMTFSDAATLLMAAYGSAAPQGAVEAVNNLKVLQPAPWDKIDRDKHADMPEQLSFLRKRMSFADALEALIANAPTLTGWEAEYRRWPERPDREASLADNSMKRMMGKFQSGKVFATLPFARPTRVVCYAPGLAAEIHLGRLWKHVEEDNAFHEFYAPAQAWRPRVVGGEEGGDQAGEGALTIMEFALPTLLALHRAVTDSD